MPSQVMYALTATVKPYLDAIHFFIEDSRVEDAEHEYLQHFCKRFLATERLEESEKKCRKAVLIDELADRRIGGY